MEIDDMAEAILVAELISRKVELAASGPKGFAQVAGELQALRGLARRLVDDSEPIDAEAAKADAAAASENAWRQPSVGTTAR
jgi:hypothetical protein